MKFLSMFIASGIVSCLSLRAQNAVVQPETEIVSVKDEFGNPTEQSIEAYQFPIGSILSTANENGVIKRWELATTQEPERMVGVLGPSPTFPESTKPRNKTMTAAEAHNPDLVKQRVVSESVGYVRYNTENGAIEKGDFITISNVPGEGMKATQEGFTIGVALESSENTEKHGLLKIRAMVRYEKL